MPRTKSNPVSTTSSAIAALSTCAPNAASTDWPTPLTVTIAAARRISGLGATTLWGLIKAQKLKAVRIGRRTLITYGSLQALLTPRSATQPQPRRRGRPRKHGSKVVDHDCG